MLKKISYAIAILIAIVGVGLICYPSFSNFINDVFANREISSYQEKIDKSSKEELQEQMQKAYEYNAKLPGAYPADPMTASNISDFTGTQFEHFSMVQEGAMIGYVEIPGIQVYLPIYYGTSEEVLKKGTGLVNKTSLPVGGEGTHAVISGHTGLPSHKLFTDLDQMKKDDIFFIHVLDQHFAYRVDQIKVVWPTQVEDLKIVDGKDYLTLLTCTPYGINDHRLLVRGMHIDYNFGAGDKESLTTQSLVDKYLWIIVVACILLILFVTLLRQKKKRSRAEVEGDR